MSDEPSLVPLSVIPESLLDVEKTLSKSRSTLFQQFDSSLQVLRNCLTEFDKLDQQCSDCITEQNKKFKNISKEKKRIEQELQTLHTEKIELEEKIKRNKSVCEEKVISDTDDDDEMADLKKKVCTLKEEMDSKRRNILHDVNEFKKGILYYNKYLKCNVLIDDRNMVIFTPNLAAERVSDVKDYIKFTTSDGITYQYVEMQPKLKNEQSMVMRFHDTEDVQGFILAFLKALGLFKGRKVKENI